VASGGDQEVGPLAEAARLDTLARQPEESERGQDRAEAAGGSG
jgi:hypothetical protein